MFTARAGVLLLYQRFQVRHLRLDVPRSSRAASWTPTPRHRVRQATPGRRAAAFLVPPSTTTMKSGTTAPQRNGWSSPPPRSGKISRPERSAKFHTLNAKGWMKCRPEVLVRTITTTPTGKIRLLHAGHGDNGLGMYVHMSTWRRQAHLRRRRLGAGPSETAPYSSRHHRPRQASLNGFTNPRTTPTSAWSWAPVW